MVNKHYNIQKYNKTCHMDSDGGDAVGVCKNNGLSSANHNFEINSANNNDENFERVCDEPGDVRHANRPLSASEADNHVNYEQVYSRHLSINSIGRFQYILQMDKELENRSDQLCNIMPSKSTITSNDINLVSRDYTKVWRDKSTRALKGPKAKITEKCGPHAKWILVILLICGLLGLTVLLMLLDDEEVKDFEQKSNLIDYSSRNREQSYNMTSNVQVKSKEIFENKTYDRDKLAVPKATDNSPIIYDFSSIEETFENEKDWSGSTQQPGTHLPVYVLKTSTESINIEHLDKAIVNPPIDDLETERESENYSTNNPFRWISFTSGHQNNFGVPIEEDKRILTLLKALQKENATAFSTTLPSVFKTHISPTLPILQRHEITTQSVDRLNNTDDVESCKSTSLPLCRGVLHYDLTTLNPMGRLSPDDLHHFQHLVISECSLRVAQFACAILEPECRPSKIGVLKPCKRICKSVLEPCAHIIASSEVLTAAFDCDTYPDSSDQSVCEDPTRRAKCYENEFQCGDKTCIPIQWRCDNIKDCSTGEDEEQCTFCEQDEYRCPTNDQCIPESYTCDKFEDCPDGADEQDCNDYEDDYSVLPSDYSTRRTFPIIHEQLPNKPYIKPYVTISEEDRYNSAANRKFEREQLHKDDDNDPIFSVGSTQIETIEKLPTAIANFKQPSYTPLQTKTTPTANRVTNKFKNFQDSKEIMMTSDSENHNEFKYSSTERAVTEFGDPCLGDELRCVNGLCIAPSQLCDKIIDCPDASDEAGCDSSN